MGQFVASIAEAVFAELSLTHEDRGDWTLSICCNDCLEPVAQFYAGGRILIWIYFRSEYIHYAWPCGSEMIWTKVPYSDPDGLDWMMKDVCGIIHKS